MKEQSKKWKEFYIKDIFITEEKTPIQVPTGAYIPKKELQDDTTPRVTVTSLNNGIDGYYTSSHKNYRIYQNFISVSFLGTVFYHPYQASLDMKVHCLQLKNVSLNFEIAEFLITVIKKSLDNASYGNQISSTDLPGKKILLPINRKGEPDYDYMLQYGKGILEKKKQKYKFYIQKILSLLKYKKILPIGEKQWKEFFITEIFSKIQRGKRLIKANQISGKIPYVSSTAYNNGVDNFISNTEKVRIFSNCLTLANSGSVGSTFYHPYTFVASDHVTHLQNDNMNEYIYLFIATLTSRFSKKYNFNREINDTRISREKIMLPVNKNNEPDYEYMEQYIKNIKYRKIKKYLDLLAVNKRV